ncbi:IclR family transcriptional regulator [Pimelobacter simplex]|uniref:IclR family transcriptional regulator n=1 Tax=Nocardioides simplex TaxID=2045 RepID=UPI003AAA7488
MTDGPASTTLGRHVRLLRHLAAAGGNGLSVTELAQRSALPHPTVHRLLQQLLAERLVRPLPGTRRYGLGALTFELGLAASRQHDLRQVCRPVLTRLAQTSGETAYLVVRSDNEAVCLDAVAGSRHRGRALAPGSRRPLAVGAGGLAIYCALDATERSAVADDLGPVLTRDWRTTPADLGSLVTRVRADGYAVARDRVTPGVTGLGLPVRDDRGRPLAALTLAGASARMNARRLPGLVTTLTHAQRAVERALDRPVGGAG